MALTDTVAEAHNDAASDKDQTDNRKLCGKNGEEGVEPTSSEGMKSPVTPAALCEPNGTPALRWKSYTSRQKELEDPEKLVGGLGSTTDAKGKLVINLCRSEAKVSRSSSAEKALLGLPKKFEGTDSSQEIGFPHNEDADAPSAGAPMGVDPIENLPSGSSESVQNCSRQLHTYKGSNATRNLAKMVCSRIRMVRRTLKASKKLRPCRTKPRSHTDDVVSNAVTPHLNRTCEEAVGNLHEDECCRKKVGVWSRISTKEQEGFVGSEEVIFSENDERSVDLHGHGKNPVGFANVGHCNSVENKVEASMTDVVNAGAGVKEVVPDDLPCSQHLPVLGNNIECPSMGTSGRDHNYERGSARSLSHEPGGFSENSKLDVKEQTVLETLLRDEPTGYSSGGGSEPSRSRRVESPGCNDFVEKSVQEEFGHTEDSESTEEESADCSQSDGYDEGDSSFSENHDCNDEDCDCKGSRPSSLLSPRNRVHSGEQVPSVLCDAEGNIWHIGKRAQQASRKGLLKQPRPASRLQESTLGHASNGQVGLLPELNGTKTLEQRVTPHLHLIDLNWKWPSDADYTLSSVGDISSRSMVHKEKAIFVGCIPDGTENLEEILQQLMEKFLERFDLAPPILSQIQLVKVVKDFAFLELATEKVAHIVLAANQLDVFEWGVNGFHFNIEGCKGTHTSVRPLIEYMPLKPARVVFVANIPKSRWQREYLEAFFARILRGSDAPEECNLVNSVYLLPESSDAYVELASEVMADAIIFKCSKNTQILKEIGDDVFICRDPSSVPLMSKHQGNICPQRSLFVGVSTPGQEFKIDLVRKVFEEILPMVSRETNQPGYLEFIFLRPGKDYAFFQFNSETIVDAFMEEYVVNTHLFVLSNTSVSYIILRPPGYKRPGARYQTDRNKNVGLGAKRSSALTFPRFGNGYGLPKSRKAESIHMKQTGLVPLLPRRFGDEPTKRTDCVMSIGVSSLLEATWNGLSSAGACTADPDCMLIIEGLPKGVSYRLLRGALNELFEISLSKLGILEVGMLVLRHLDRDSNLDVVASLPNSKFVKALLALKKTLVIAGHELKLLPKVGKRQVTWEGKIAELTIRGQGEVSCVSDNEVYQDELAKSHVGNWTIRPNLVRQKREVSNLATCVHGRRNIISRRKQIEWESGMGYAENIRSASALLQKDCIIDIRDALKIPKRAGKVLSRQKARTGFLKAIPAQQQMERSFKEMIPHAQNAVGPLKFGRRDLTANAEDLPGEILHIVSEGGKRKIRSLRTAPKVFWNSGNAGLLKLIGKKRKLFQSDDSASVTKALSMQQSFKKLRQGSRVL